MKSFIKNPADRLLNPFGSKLSNEISPSMSGAVNSVRSIAIEYVGVKADIFMPERCCSGTVMRDRDLLLGGTRYRGDVRYRGPRRQPVQSLRHLIGYLRHRSEEHTSELQSLMRISYAD